MKFRSAIAILVVVVAAIPVFYDVDFGFVLQLPGSEEIPDPDVESAYQSCYREKDAAIHATAFGTIDNPDVQKEYISAHRTRAKGECRRQHPARMITAETPFRFNLVDLTPRYW
jgi:hypothetical protein